MSTVAVAPGERTEIVQWLAPAPLWDTLPVGAGSSGLAQPWICELRTDDFVDDFTAMLAGTAGSPADLAGLAPDTTTDGVAGSPYRLYQPLSQRYYLLTATLACRRPGIPDHVLRADRSERAYFVMRRLTGGHEQAFLPDGDGGTWVDTEPGRFVLEEREYPLHQAPVAPYAGARCTTAALGLGEGGGGRTVWFGYIPVAAERTLTRPMADPAGAMTSLLKQKSSGQHAGLDIRDPRLDQLFQRVVDPWSRLKDTPAAGNKGYASLYLLLDLGAWLREHLATEVYARLGMSNPGLADPAEALVQWLQLRQVRAPAGMTTVAKALKSLETWEFLLRGEDPADHRLGDPPTGYDVNAAAIGPDVLHARAAAALTKAGRAVTVPPELEGMIQERPAPSVSTASPAGGKSTGATYVARLVLRYDPCCCVVSAPTHPFQLARALDADAPARKILLQVPDITHLRAFKRGVAIETPASLQTFLTRLTPDFLKDDELGSPQLQLGMICAFSLQIIFLVAFIVMFIFLLLLNFVFWWLPFLKICFPIPVVPSSRKGPTP